MDSQKASEAAIEATKEQRKSTETAPSRPPLSKSTSEPPMYYDSEPSSQPPKYPNPTPISKSTNTIPLHHLSSNPPRPPRGTPTPASTINAILGSPGVDIDAQRRAERKNKSLRERWRGFRERNFGEREQNDGEERDWSGRGGSAAQWNVWGSRIGGGMTTPYKIKSGR